MKNRITQVKLITNRRKHFSLESLTIALFAIVTLSASFVSIGNHYIQRADSRVVLQQGKAVLLAMQAVSAECYGQDIAFADQSGDGGFAEGIEKSIKELSGCPGEIYLLQWDAKEHRIVKFCYVQGSYAAVYEVNKNQDIQWDVFRIQSKM